MKGVTFNVRALDTFLSESYFHEVTQQSVMLWQFVVTLSLNTDSRRPFLFIMINIQADAIWGSALFT